ncbi:MAG: BNR-4 repeat-containing protein [Flavobacteriales bacterium]|nr:BNR-4 repeat-containing protein [Flavobacteriales bacterium]MBP9081141.1 BNR-4 repeat-containing protein [Flavobacteriales bacterium]
MRSIPYHALGSLLLVTSASAQLPLVVGVDMDTLDTQAETFDGQWKHTANANLATQDALTTYGGVQYASWFSTDNRLHLARKADGQSAWETIVFTDYLKTSADSHNGIAVGICPNDGTVHLSFDNHNDLMNYRRSLPGLITGAVPWSVSSFLPVQHTLHAASNYTDQFTYPRFLTVPNGNLIIQFRSWVTEVNNRVVYYDGNISEWTADRKMVSGSGPYTDPVTGTCNSRRMYDNNLTYDRYGKLTTTFTWRENDDPAYNHDFAFLYSEDDGWTWKNNAHQVVSNASTGLAANYATPGMNVVNVPPAFGMINDQGHAVDQRGGIHIVANQADVPVQVYGFVSNGYYRHHWGKADGSWHTRVLSIRGDRPRLTCDAFGNLFLMYTHAGAFRIATASPVDDYAHWMEVYSANLNIGNFFSVDHVRFRETGELNLMAQANPVVLGDPTPLFVIRVHLEYDPLPCGTADDACPARVMRLDPSDDTYTGSGTFADEVFGNSDEKVLRAKYGSDNGNRHAVTYLRFMLADVVNTGKLAKATLRLRVKKVSANSAPTDVYRLFRCDHNFWTEGSLSHHWPLRPGIADTLAVAAVADGILEYDVTEVMRDELTGDDWLSFAIDGSQGNTGNVVFYSKDVNNAARWPELTLEYAPNVIYPVADAQVRAGGYANDNFGSDQEMVIKENAGEDYDRMAYLKFDVSSFAGVVPARVYLRMDKKAWSPQAHSTPYAAFPVADDGWQEQTINFNNRPLPGDTLLDAHYGREEMRWDVTHAFNEASTGDGILSVAVKGLLEGDARNVNVFTKENADSTVWPRLVVLYGQALPPTADFRQVLPGPSGPDRAGATGTACHVLYPNPATVRVAVAVSDGLVHGMDVYAPTGGLVRSFRPVPSASVEFPTSGLPAGMYIVNILRGTGLPPLHGNLLIQLP